MHRIRVIQMGIGSVGKGVTRALSLNKGIEIVGALDTNKALVGDDLGDIAGVGRKLGVVVTADDSLFSEVQADIVIHTTTARHLHDAFQEMLRPITARMDLVTANVEASDPYFFDPLIAEKLEKAAIENNATLLGTGSVQATDRLIIGLTEQCNEVERIIFSAHKDVGQFNAESNRLAFGIGLSQEEYQERVQKSDDKHSTIRWEIDAIARRIGWKLDEISLKALPLLDDKGMVIGEQKTCQGIEKDKMRISMEVISTLDPKHEYYHKINIHGVPSIDALIHYSPDRSLQGSIAPLVNAIPYVIKSPPGILRVLDMPICSVLQPDTGLFITLHPPADR
jgi:2,4-diaminopentanoate dehydrogenase